MMKHDEELIAANNPTVGRRLRELIEALEPFAKYADQQEKFPADFRITNGSMMAKRQLTMGDCYRAARALKEPG